MLADLFHTFLYVPIYNLLIFLVDIIPGADIGLAVILVTVIVRLLILPLSLSALRTGRAMHALQPKLKAIQADFKDDKEKQAKETFALYKKYKLNPFASILAVFVQLPILIALYFVFLNELTIDPALLYSFVEVPARLSTEFLGLIPLSGNILSLAIAAAVFQYLQARYAMPTPTPAKGSTSMSDQLNRSLAIQAKYVFPILIGWLAYISSGAIALYFITTSIFTLAQELILKALPKHPIHDELAAAN